MTDTAVISGDFCTFRHVQGRKVLQIVIEVPAEAAGSVFAKLGMPGSGEGIPVAVARLQTPSEPIAKPEAPKERLPFTELPYSTQAAIRCGEPDFQRFLKEMHPQRWALEESAPTAVRSLMGVETRAHIARGTEAGKRWQALEAEYYVWQRGMR